MTVGEAVARNLLTPAEVAARLTEALAQRRGLALVRLGDGEALTLAQEVVLPIPEILDRGPFLSYAGVTVPDLAARDALARAILRSDIVGVPTAAAPNYWPLLQTALAAHGINLASLALTTSVINYALHSEGHLARLLLATARAPRVLVAGNLAPQLAGTLVEQGVNVTGVVVPVAGIRDVERAYGEVRHQVFDLALVAAGIPAVVLCAAIARELGKVAIDFGHLADELIRGKKRLGPRRP